MSDACYIYWYTLRVDSKRYDNSIRKNRVLKSNDFLKKRYDNSIRKNRVLKSNDFLKKRKKKYRFFWSI